AARLFAEPSAFAERLHGQSGPGEPVRAADIGRPGGGPASGESRQQPTSRRPARKSAANNRTTSRRSATGARRATDAATRACFVLSSTDSRAGKWAEVTVNPD